MTIQQKQRKADGLCVDCGRPLSASDRHNKCVRCMLCREKKKHIKVNDEPSAAVEQWAANKLALWNNRKPQRRILGASSGCKCCQWVACVGPNQWFCPLPYCARAYMQTGADSNGTLD